MSCPSLQSRALAVLVSCLPLAGLCAGTSGKQLIEFGWDEPDTAFLREHITEMEKLPFDGCVFHAITKDEEGKSSNFSWTGWGSHSYDKSDLTEAFADLRAIRWGHFNRNFLRFNVTPGDVDWFQDFGAVLNNARLAAQLARTGRGCGILLDVEPYDAPLFDFRKQKNPGEKSFSAYQDQARRRGQEVMESFQRGFPGLTVFLTFGYSISWEQMQNGPKPLIDCQYGLLPAFLDGLVAGANGKTRIVDGCELAYGYRRLAQFKREYDLMQGRVLPLVADSQKYHKVMSFGFGLWLDFNSHKLGWNAEDVSKNYFTPEDFQASLEAALQVADQYVWVYTEQPRWWSSEGGPLKLPSPYIQAIRAAEKP